MLQCLSPKPLTKLHTMKHTAKLDPKKETAGRDPTDRHLTGAITITATIADAQIDGALKRYGLTVDSDTQRYIYFFDTPDLALFKAGIIARARRNSGDDHDSTVKFHPVVPSEVPAIWRECDGCELEADASEAEVTKSASLTVAVSKGLIKQVVTGEKGITKLFAKEQDEFLTAMGGHAIEYDTLCVLGPVAGHRWKFADPACPWRLSAELWQREDEARLMEVAIQVPLAQAEVAIAGFKVFLSAVGAERHMKQQSKTRWALEHYVKVRPTDTAA